MTFLPVVRYLLEEEMERDTRCETKTTPSVRATPWWNKPPTVRRYQYRSALGDSEKPLPRRSQPYGEQSTSVAGHSVPSRRPHNADRMNPNGAALALRRVAGLGPGVARRGVETAASPLPFERIPAPRGLPFLGSTLAFIAAGSAPKLHEYVDARHKQLGPIFRDRIGPVTAVFVADPKEMRAVFAGEGKHPAHLLPEAWTTYNKTYGCSRGLFFMEGEEWWRNRRAMNGFLLKGDLKWIEASCAEPTRDLVRRLHEHHVDEVIPHLERHLYAWSLEVITSVLLGARSYAANKSNLGTTLERLASVVREVFENTNKLYVVPSDWAAKLRIPRWKRFVRSVDDALSTSNELLRLMSSCESESDGLLRKMNSVMDDETVKKIVVDLILAAGDTTAYSMEWILYSVSRNPHVQAELAASTCSTLTKHVVRETLRLYPVAPFLTRILPQDAVVNNYVIPKNTLIVLSIYTSGRDPQFFDRPHEFLPQRWSRCHSDYHTSMQLATIPFAMGARSCVGRKIAETQLLVALEEIVKGFRLVSANEDQLEISMRMVAVPSKPVKLKLVKR